MKAIRLAPRDCRLGKALKNINLQANYTEIPFRLLNFYYAVTVALWLVIAVGWLS